jgi:hypothetical protein
LLIYAKLCGLIISDIIILFSIIVLNILRISDIISPHNLAYINNKLICVDLDGISHYDSHEQLIASKEYENMISIFKEIDSIQLNNGGESLLNKYPF